MTGRRWENALLAATLAVAGLIPFNYLPNSGLTLGAARVPLTFLVFAPLGTAAFIRFAFWLKENGRFPTFFTLVAVFVASLAVSCLFAPEKNAAVSTVAGFLLRSVAMAALAFVIASDDEKRALFMAWIPWVGAAVALGALAELAAGRYLIFERGLPPGVHHRELWRPDLGIALGAIGQPLPLSAFLNAVFPLALWRWCQRRDGWTLAAPIIIGAAIFMTFRRTGYVVLAFSTIVVLMSTDRKAAVRIVLGVAIVLIGLAAHPRSRKNLTERLNPSMTVKELSAGHRVEVYRTAGRFLREHPFIGIGTRQYEKQIAGYATYDNALGTPDNQYLRLLAENGLLGFSAFVGLCGFLLVSLWQNRAGEGLPFFLSAAGFVATMVFLDGLYWPAPSMMFMAIAGAGMGRIERSRRETMTHASSLRG